MTDWVQVMNDKLVKSPWDKYVTFSNSHALLNGSLTLS